MALKFCSFASSSSGNSYLVESEKTKLLIDVGIAGKKVIEGLAERNLTLEDLDGILITHEHSDHVKSIRMISKKASNAKVFTSRGTASEINDKVEAGKFNFINADCEFNIGDICVKSFNLSHDAVEPMGFSFTHNERKLSIVTDTGYITKDIFNEIYDSDFLVLEANHEINILKMGAYPYNLKQRILGNKGHLSNEAAGECICRMLHQRENKDEIPKIVLAHLSSENNTPAQAYLTIRNILFEEDFYIGKDLEMDIIRKNQVSPLMEV